jgi:hypothetical protein
MAGQVGTSFRQNGFEMFTAPEARIKPLVVMELAKVIDQSPTTDQAIAIANDTVKVELRNCCTDSSWNRFSRLFGLLSGAPR